MKPSNRASEIYHHSDVSEKSIEAYLCKRVRALDGLCLKYSNPNMTGFPDRLVLLPDGVSAWLELKSKGEKPREIQLIRHSQLERLGHRVYVIDSRSGVDNLINDLISPNAL